MRGSEPGFPVYPAPQAAPSALFPQRSALSRRDGCLCSMNGKPKATCRQATNRFLSPLSLNPSLPIPPVGEERLSVPARGRACKHPSPLRTLPAVRRRHLGGSRVSGPDGGCLKRTGYPPSRSLDRSRPRISSGAMSASTCWAIRTASSPISSPESRLPDRRS